jgi:flagellar protein FliS
MTQQPGAPSRYLDARVSTASQPELQLMLLDGALRFGKQAQQLWGAKDRESEWAQLMDRTFDIVEELVRSAVLGTTNASKRLEEEYAFAFRQLARARLSRDAVALESALKLLAFHRETWKLACDKVKAEATQGRPGLSPHVNVAALGSGLSLEG